jgi:hypothetical protein
MIVRGLQKTLLRLTHTPASLDGLSCSWPANCFVGAIDSEIVLIVYFSETLCLVFQACRGNQAGNTKSAVVVFRSAWICLDMAWICLGYGLHRGKDKSGLG